jgi:hypothetical protein
MDIHKCKPDELKSLYDLWLRYRPAADRKAASPQELDRLRNDIFGNPFSRGEGTSRLFWEGDQLIAHLRCSPCPAYYSGELVESCWWQSLFTLPDAAGNPRGDAAAFLMLKLRAEPRGHAVLGTPGTESPVFKLYQRMRFDYWGAVPFFYLVLNGSNVLRNLAIFKRNAPLALAAGVASVLYLPGKLMAFRHRRPRQRLRHFQMIPWPAFSPEADALWEAVRGKYGLIFDRTTPYLNWRYGEPCYERLGVLLQKRLVGWAVCKTTQMKEDRYFGNLCVGSIVDLLVDPEKDVEVNAVLSLAVEKLSANGADLIVTNLTEQRLIASAARVGFLAGPSNYHFLTLKLRRAPLGECHITRGDSDGDYFL